MYLLQTRGLIGTKPEIRDYDCRNLLLISCLEVLGNSFDFGLTSQESNIWPTLGGQCQIKPPDGALISVWREKASLVEYFLLPSMPYNNLWAKPKTLNPIP